MSDSLSNKELVAVGHQFAKAMSSDTALIDMAKIVSRLAERLDCATLALREMTKQRDALGAENAGLKQSTPYLQTMMSALDAFFADEDVPERAMLGAYNILRDAVPTPATDVYLADVRAQGADAVADQHRRKYEEIKPINVFFAKDHKEAQRVAEFVAAQLRQGGAA